MKKFAALLLALLLAVMPMAGYAATTAEIMDAAYEAGHPTRTTVSFVPGNLTMFLGAEGNAAYTDLLNALGLTLYDNGKDSGQGGIAMTLQGDEVLTAEFALDEDRTTYMASNLLGDTVLAVKSSEWRPLLEKFADLMVRADVFTTSDAAEFKQQLDAMFNSEGGLNPDAEEAFANVDWSKVESVVMGLMEKAETTAVAETNEDFDQAVSKVSVTLTVDDIVLMYQTMADVLMADAAAMSYLNAELAGSGMTAEAFLTEMLSGIRESMAMLQGGVPVTYYVSAAGNIVAMDMRMTMEVDGAQVSVPVRYTRKTLDQGVTHTVTLDAVVGVVKMISFSGSYLDAGEAGLLLGEMHMGDGEIDVMSIKADAVFDDNNMDASMELVVNDDGEVTELDMTLVAVEKENAETANFKLTVQSAEETIEIFVDAKDEQTPGEAEASAKGSMTLGLTADGVTMSLVGDYETRASTTADGAEKQTGCDVKLSVMGIEIPLLTINTVTETCEARAELKQSGTVHPAVMNDEELDAYGVQVAQTMQVELMELVQKLPESLLKLMNE
ncbi:MAG: hypothetical protein IJ507_08630 [Clostridia bacterium]|nr:hypothetical protein [Clostridia bacterium]